MIKHINKRIYSRYCSDEHLMLIEALSNKTRQGIIRIIAEKKEIPVNDIAEMFSLSRPTISHHLNLMKRAKLLIAHKEGKKIYYSINKTRAIKVIETILNILKKCC